MGAVGREEPETAVHSLFFFKKEILAPRWANLCSCRILMHHMLSFYIKKVLHLSQLFRTSLSLAISIQVSVIYLLVT